MTFDELVEKASRLSRTPHVFGPPIERVMLDAWTCLQIRIPDDRTPGWHPAKSGSPPGSYNMDHSDYWVLKISTGEYFWMDSCGADETSRIGGSVAELLDWMWAHCAP